MSRECDVAVIGGGVVGLAAAAALARAGRSVALLERHDGFARETSSRNSEVVHAGLYYPPGSWKARLCVAGREALYARCQRLRLPHRRLGKLVVASAPQELEVLERLRRTGTENGAPGLELIDGRALQELEPHVRGLGALVSPATGIVDAHALALSYAAEAEAHGAVLALRSEVVALEHAAPGWRIAVRGAGEQSASLACVAVVNAAGLACDRVAELAGVDLAARGLRLHRCKGDYFSLAPGAPIQLQRLVYPVPGVSGLGIHATLDLGGRMRFGPDAEYVERIDYAVDSGKATRFAAAAGRYLPALRPEWLAPDYAGIRPRLAGPGEGFRDFVIEEGSAQGLPGLVNLIGIESPGLTAAPAIAEQVVALLAGI